ncbi:thiamine phosphate synthase [Fulvivirga maritima]|uniref:thiamine phosphate synthase n=1 Tax=Fulvivirga maritima TaxID=2904247 RepID=UPI001F24E5E9|nr:thiamine phosphate synthase [Fulvivirga maritima]UII25097.1 thiamine phosphate synthase [Fulvivirga maritima]
MQVVIITHERNCEGEIDTVKEILDQGLHLHIRKPHYSDSELSNYLEQLPKECRSQMVLHGNVQLAEAFQLGGFHLKSTQEHKLASNWSGSLSRSFHTWKALKSYQWPLSYAFLSPVFNSISKQNYKAQFDHEQLKKELTKDSNIPVLALGGVTVDLLRTVVEMGFAGAALLGEVWTKPTVKERLQIIHQIKEYA